MLSKYRAGKEKGPTLEYIIVGFLSTRGQKKDPFVLKPKKKKKINYKGARIRLVSYASATVDVRK